MPAAQAAATATGSTIGSRARPRYPASRNRRRIALLSPDAAAEVLKRAKAAGVPARVIGRTGGQELRIAVGGQLAIAVGVSEAERIWSGAVERYFAKQVA